MEFSVSYICDLCVQICRSLCVFQQLHEMDGCTVISISDRWTDLLKIHSMAPVSIWGLYGVCVQDKDFNDPIQLFSFSRRLYKLVGFVMAFSYIWVILCSYLFSPHCTCWSSSPSQINPPLCFHAICIITPSLPLPSPLIIFIRLLTIPLFVPLTHTLKSRLCIWEKTSFKEWLFFA